MKEEIKNQIEIIDESIEWAQKFGKESFPVEELKEYKRQIKRIRDSLSGKCSAAAYGESQVGKSYLIHSLLSTPESPFIITNNGKDYSFIDEINPSGGNTSKTESTGVITRFTIQDNLGPMAGFIKIKNLSVADIIMLLVDSYYNDLKLDTNTILSHDDLNNEIANLQYLWNNHTDISQNILEEDDVKDICDYISDVIGSNAIGITHSEFNEIISSKIKYVATKDWGKIFSLLWNKNTEITHLFSLLITEYEKLKFKTEVYVPFDSVLRKNGSLLQIEWLDEVCGIQHEKTGIERDTDVYSSDGKILAKHFSKSYLSALISELTFRLPEKLVEERSFLNKIDLLDFPGARSREKFKEENLKKVLPTILRRGKVAYLFNKYSRSLKISSVLFSHHNDQKNEPSLGETINDWIEANIGETPEKRTDYLTKTNGISPLFFIATKFNIELERTKNDTPNNKVVLNEHWKRFNTVIPEIIKPAKWFEDWVIANSIFPSTAFQNIYPLRDFYWSAKTQVFDGYKDGNIKSPELKVHNFSDYPNFFDNLKQSFMDNNFVRKHFRNPEKTWNEVATINNDGSKAIIRDLNSISCFLESARNNKFKIQLREIKEKIQSKLMVYYEPKDKEQNNQRIRKIIGNIRRKLDLNIGQKPEIFGHIIDQLMIPVNDLRKIAYDIVVLKTDTPKDLNEIMLIRTMANINPEDSKSENLQKLCNYYVCSENILKEDFKQKGFSIEDVISNDCNIATTVADVISNHILAYWVKFINKQIKTVDKFLPHTDELAFMLQSLCKELGVKKTITQKIDSYSKMFSDNDLPNVIADFSALTLNNFVSTVGREYMTEKDIEVIKDKANSCNLSISFSSHVNNVKHNRLNIIEALQAFDEAENPSSVSITTLMKLPFWDNFQRWKNYLTIGILYSADISHSEPMANSALEDLLRKNKVLFN